MCQSADKLAGLHLGGAAVLRASFPLHSLCRGCRNVGRDTEAESVAVTLSFGERLVVVAYDERKSLGASTSTDSC
jgi:hypothetical protein